MENVDFYQKIRKLKTEQFWFSAENVLILRETDFFSEKSTFCTNQQQYVQLTCMCKESEKKAKNSNHIQNKEKFKGVISELCFHTHFAKRVKQSSALANCSQSHVTFSIGLVRASGEQQQGTVPGDKELYFSPWLFFSPMSPLICLSRLFFLPTMCLNMHLPVSTLWSSLRLSKFVYI